MKKTTIGLSCLLLLVGAVRANAKDPKQTRSDESPSFVGDYLEADETHDDSHGSTLVGDPFDGFEDDGHLPEFGSPLPPIETDGPAPTAVPAQHGATRLGSRWDGVSCDEGYGSVGSVVDGCNRKWLRAETLLWFPQLRDSPPLVTANDGAGEPLTTQFGDEIGAGLAPGYRLDFGHYFGNGNIGAGARVWGLYDASENFSESSPGTFDLRRPFFNTDLGTSDALIIADSAGQFSGSVNATSELDIFATEAYGRVMFGQAPNFHVDLIGGYSYFGIDDSLDIRSSTTTERGSFASPTGTVRTFRDTFDTENHFQGGQLGFETMLKKGRWSMFSLTKVHLGNMDQRVRISGSSSSTTPGVPTERHGNGFFVQGQQGSYQRDEFTFVPEVNVKMAYLLRRHISVSVGYSFLYWNDIALAGDQIDDRLDPTLFLTSQRNPELEDFAIRDSSFWIQGIDLGVTIDF